MTRKLPWFIAIGETLLAVWSVIRVINGQYSAFTIVAWIIVSMLFVWCWALQTKTTFIWKDLFFKNSQSRNPGSFH